MSKPRRYLVLPARGLQASVGVVGDAAAATLVELANGPGVASMRARLKGLVREVGNGVALSASQPFKVVASLNEDGVKLVDASSEMIAALRFERPGLRVVPETFYKPAVSVPHLRQRLARATSSRPAVARRLVVTVTNASGDAVPGVLVIGFTDFASRAGVQAVTSRTGKATLSSTGAAKFERLYVQHDLPGLWSFFKKNVSTAGDLTVKLAALDLSVIDSRRSLHLDAEDITPGTGVKVGVIDSGIDERHADLAVAGGLGCVPGSREDRFGASGSHGTHVAGIIAGRGSVPTGVRGLAPGAALFSYRVFDDSPSSGSSFSLVKAIRRGIADGCDLLNMSLSFDHDENTGLAVVDEAVKDAIEEAHAAGVVVITAAGNDGRKPVAYPASDPLAIAVSAVGKKGTFPANSSEAADLAAPFGRDRSIALAAFTNIGAEIDVAGAGVGVVSTVPGGYAPMSGTSMACPVITGVLARLLANAPVILNMTRDANRADAIKSILFANARSLGLGVIHEGKGLPA